MYKQINTSMDTILAYSNALVLDKKWIFLLINQRYNSDKLCRHFCEPEKLGPPLGPPPLNPPSLNVKITKKRKYLEENYVLQRDKGMQTQAQAK